MLLLVLLILSPWDLVVFLMIASLLSSSLYLTACFLGRLNGFFLWTKFCILLTLLISWVHLCYIQVLGSQVLPTNPLGSKARTSLSLVICRKEDSGCRTWALTISVFCLGWLRYGWFSISLFMDFDSPCCIVTSSLLCELSYTLSPYACLKCEIALVLTWSRSMYYDCSILYLASCATWFVRRLWSAPVRLYLLLVRLDLFAALCHNALVTTHVCFVMVFVSSVDVTFSWLVSIPALSWAALMVHTFLIVEHVQWASLVCGRQVVCACDRWWFLSLLVAIVPRSHEYWLALLFEWPMLVLRFI